MFMLSDNSGGSSSSSSDKTVGHTDIRLVMVAVNVVVALQILEILTV